MHTVYRVTRAAVAAGVLCSAAPDLASGARVETRPLRVQAEFQHVPPTGPTYATLVTGVLELGFTVATDGTAELQSVVGGGSCFMTAGWMMQGTLSATTTPAELCLANAAVDEAGFNTWMAGQGGSDPSVALGLIGGGSPPTSWTNPGALPIQLFLRGCGNDAYRTAGSLTIPSGALVVQQYTDPAGNAQLDVAAMSLSLVAAAAPVWADVLMGCGGMQAGLPVAPSPGVSTLFTATTATPPGDSSLPHVQIGQIHDAVDALVEMQALARGRGRALGRELDDAIKKLRQAKPEAAVQQLQRFQSLTTVYEQRGFLSPAAAGALRGQAGAAGVAIDMITVDGTVPPPDPDLFCDPAPAVCPIMGNVYTTYHVRQGRDGIGLLPDGSEARPFRTIVAALAAAAAAAFDGVELMVAGGRYPGDLVITRNTRIIGDPRRPAFIEGSITSDGAYRLVVQDVRIRPPEGPGISVDDACASTRVDGVRVEQALGYGVLQRGGAIEIADTLVESTESEAANLTRGTGVYLTCGVAARLDDVTLVSNASAALVVVGQGTSAQGADLSVSGSGVHPSLEADPCAAPSVIGAVQVRLGASARFNIFSIRDNDAIGLLVDGEDADGQPSEATFRDGTIAQTHELAGDCGFGINAVVIEDGELALDDFVLTQADLAAIVLARGGVADLDSGDVNANLIGVSVQTRGFDVGRLTRDVRYFDNGRNLDAAVLPVPGAIGDVGP